MRKKLLFAGLLFFISCFFWSAHAIYVLTDSDLKVVDRVVGKIEVLVSKKWENYRPRILRALKALEVKHSQNERIVWIIDASVQKLSKKTVTVVENTTFDWTLEWIGANTKTRATFQYPSNYIVENQEGAVTIKKSESQSNEQLYMQVRDESMPKKDEYTPFMAKYISTEKVSGYSADKYYTRRPQVPMVSDSENILPYTEYNINISAKKTLRIYYFSNGTDFEWIISTVKIESETNSKWTVIYIDKERGFQFSLSDNWAQYKTKTVDMGDGRILIAFLLPTTDADWKNSEQDYPGYAQAFSLIVWKNTLWMKHISACKQNPNVEDLWSWMCAIDLAETRVVWKTDVHTVVVMPNQTGPLEFNKYFTSMNGSILTGSYSEDWIVYLKNSFMVVR